MPQLQLDQRLIERLAAELHQATTWEMGTETIDWRVATPNEIAHQIHGDDARVGGPTYDELWGSGAVKQLSQLATAVVIEGRLLINQANLEQPAAALEAILIHELLHVAQHRHHSSFIRQAEALRRQFEGPFKDGGWQNRTFKSLYGSWEARAAWLEGHAQAVQEALRPGAASNGPLWLLSLAARWIRPLEPAFQAARGAKVIKNLMLEAPELIDQIYNQPQLADRLLKQNKWSQGGENLSLKSELEARVAAFHPDHATRSRLGRRPSLASKHRR